MEEKTRGRVASRLLIPRLTSDLRTLPQHCGHCRYCRCCYCVPHCRRSRQRHRQRHYITLNPCSSNICRYGCYTVSLSRQRSWCSSVLETCKVPGLTSAQPYACSTFPTAFDSALSVNTLHSSVVRGSIT
jgi:hypothetical protein